MILADPPDIRDRLDAGYSAGSAELALRKHGLTSRELLRLAHAAADAGLKQMKPPPPLDHGEREDLVSAILEAGLRWALVYDIDQDAKRNFATSVYSRMRRRVTDWCRTNIHDARFGTDKRHMALDINRWGNGNELPDEETIAPTRPTVPWSDTTGDAFVEPDFQEASVSRMRTERWERAARLAGMPLNDWITDVLDTAAALEEAA